MIAYKEKQFLIFDFEDGKTVKYNLNSGESIGKSGRVVKNINTQLRGYSLQELINSFPDENYRNFLNFLNKNFVNFVRGGYWWSDPTVGTRIKNIGSFLSRISNYTFYEQYFSQGIENIDRYFKKKVNELPKGYLNFCKKHDIKVSEETLARYANHSNEFVELEGISKKTHVLNYNSITSMCIPEYSYYNGKCTQRENNYSNYYRFKLLVDTYHYNKKRLITYIDDLLNYEGIESLDTLLRELVDYNKMISAISIRKYEKYPKYFLSMHTITCRNYNRLNKEFPVEDFNERIDKQMEFKYKDYVFIYPDSPQDIKDEAVQQTNCVASYIDDVMKGKCHIMFLRNKEALDKSLVTLEIKDYQVVQAKRAFNNATTKEDEIAIRHFNKHLSKLQKARLNKQKIKIQDLPSMKTHKLKNKNLSKSA